MATMNPAVSRVEGKGKEPHTSTRAMWIGVVFAFVFTGIIYLAGSALDPVRATLLPDQGASWYYWKLPEPTLASRLSVWGLYIAHQVSLWGLIWYAQTRVKKYTTGLHRVNVIALGVNALFIGLHFIQSHIWYDGLAQDVSIFSSQGSVILMLIWIMLMENNRRGMFFGKKLPIGKRIIQFARKYHGYVFSWAIIYTFWYHPMETTPGHLMGFFYMFLLMLQGSLFLTRIHVNKWWMVTQEVMVLAHGAVVAYIQQQAYAEQGEIRSIWPMFFFGFFAVFVLTQMYGLNLKRWMRWGIFALFGVLVFLAYNGRELFTLNEIVRIPAIYYLCVFILALLIGGGLWLYERIKGKGTANPVTIGAGD